MLIQYYLTIALCLSFSISSSHDYYMYCVMLFTALYALYCHCILLCILCYCTLLHCCKICAIVTDSLNATYLLSYMCRRQPTVACGDRS